MVPMKMSLALRIEVEGMKEEEKEKGIEVAMLLDEVLGAVAVGRKELVAVGMP